MIFAAPWVLLALPALPLLWWLLRVTPPAPRSETFPAIRLLMGLHAREETPARTPWWLLALRMIAATEAGWFVLRSPDVLKLWLLIPLRDLFGAAVWCAGLFGRTVEWRGRRLRLDSEGRIQ